MRLIDADALKDMHNMGIDCDCNDCKQDWKACQYDKMFSLMDFCEWIDDAPTIEPERKKGKWLQTVKHYKDDEQEFDYIETTCSVCGVKKRIGWTGANYCPNCGADMRGEQDG